MSPRLILIGAVSAAALLTTVGCSVARDQSTVGEYIDDATLTTRVKAKLADDPTVSAMAIHVETLNGEVVLSGFAKNATEKAMAERLARSTSGVKKVRDDIIVRPAG